MYYLRVVLDEIIFGEFVYGKKIGLCVGDWCGVNLLE